MDQLTEAVADVFAAVLELVVTEVDGLDGVVLTQRRHEHVSDVVLETVVR